MAVAALAAGEWGCSSSEDRMLRLAASIADAVPVDLGPRCRAWTGMLSGLDGDNASLIAAAVLRAVGHGTRWCYGS